jgi:hypothetical protein
MLLSNKSNDLLGVFFFQANGDNVNSSKAFKENRLAFHDWHGGFRADVSETENCSAVLEDK